MVKPMTVADLIALLQTFPQHLPVAFEMHSEYELLEASHLNILTLCEPRPDGWIHDRRPDKSTKEYLVFPGN